MTNKMKFSQLHDSTLYSLSVERGTDVTFLFKLIDGSIQQISVNNSVQLLCSEFLLGNIVFECGFWNSAQCINKEILPESEYVDIDQIVEKNKDGIQAGQIGIFYISSSYGANLYCVGAEPVLHEK